MILAAVATAARRPGRFRRARRPAGRDAPGPLTPARRSSASALTGAVLVVGSDIIARTILPVELPVGIVTSALGGPFLLYLLVRNNRKVSA